MRVLFVQKDFYPRLGILSLASVARKDGHITDLAITDIDDLKEKLLEFRPGVVALSMTSGQLQWAQKSAHLVKENLGLHLPVIVGGAHPTFYPEVVAEECFDIACRGESEDSFPLLLRALEGGDSIESVPNLVYILGGRLHHTPLGPPPDLDRLPFPAYGLITRYGLYPRMGFLTLMTSRGCPFSCTFCHIPLIRRLHRPAKSPVYRRMSPKAVVEQIRYARNLHPEIHFVRFEDDFFSISPRPWLERFCTLYRKHVALPFECQIRLDQINKQNAHLLKTAGCRSAKVAIESADDAIRNEVYNKRLSRDTIIKGIKILKEEEFLIEAGNIIGAPAETIDQALETYAFNLGLGVHTADCSNLYAHQRTPLAVGLRQSQGKDEYYYHINPGGNAEFENLVKLFALGIVLRIPRNVMRRLISVPTNPLYGVMYWVGQILIKIRLKCLRPRNLLAMLKYSLGFFNIDLKRWLSLKRSGLPRTGLF